MLLGLSLIQKLDRLDTDLCEVRQAVKITTTKNAKLKSVEKFENFLHIVTTMSGQNTAQHGRNVSSEALAENSDTSSDDNDRNWSFPSITSW